MSNVSIDDQDNFHSLGVMMMCLSIRERVPGGTVKREGAVTRCLEAKRRKGLVTIAQQCFSLL